MEQQASPVAEYESPDVVDYGDLLELTAAQTDGGFTDESFPAKTPVEDLTFSN